MTFVYSGGVTMQRLLCWGVGLMKHLSDNSIVNHTSSSRRQLVNVTPTKWEIWPRARDVSHVLFFLTSQMEFKLNSSNEYGRELSKNKYWKQTFHYNGNNLLASDIKYK